jgi:adenine-specific DNA-methyltransferase
MLMGDIQAKFQQLLRELFQFDSADLDFGIYRIMNHKREAIERFITEGLPESITEELGRGALAEQSHAQEALSAAREKVLDALGDEALDAEGNLVDQYRNTPAGRAYAEAQAKATGAQDQASLEAAIYNHLYTFFSRYYQDGDFISKRRYSRKERYAIPYNGEEVYLYWANNDQYYIKTAEYFTDYTWKAPDVVTVHFKLKAADVEQGNVKGDKRFFLPRMDEIAWEEEDKMLIIPFVYRPLTEGEGISYGKSKQQDKIIAEFLEAVPKKLSKNTAALAAITAEWCKDAQGNPVSYLAHHLRQYTARNTRDFFIHKDLKGFLSRELDFYLKNEVLNLEEMESSGESLSEGWFQLMRLIKRVGNHIIDFLAQIESFQKMLWEKRKFVTEVFYCITVGNIPEEFYDLIATNDTQWEEWNDLFAIEAPNGKKNRLAFLKDHPALVFDTRHFDDDFVDCLLSSFDEIEGSSDGLLLHSENWQSLILMNEKFRGRINAIYIDPPYNSPSSEIIYKNNYKHSTWATLMYDRLRIPQPLLGEDAGLAIAIDDHEVESLKSIICRLYGDIAGTVVVRSNPAGRSTPKGFSLNHEYALFAWNERGATRIGKLPHTKKQSDRYKEIDGIGPFEWVNFRKHGGLREESPQMYYPIFIDKNKNTWRIPIMEWHEDRDEWVLGEDPKKNEEEIWPKDEQGQARRWKWSVDRLLDSPSEVKVNLDKNGDLALYIKSRKPPEGVTPPTWWEKKKYSATDWGTRELKNLFGRFGGFDYPKAVGLVEDCLRVVSTRPNDFIMDYFAGSGTTGHAVINLNREDSGQRKFILVEIGEYFDTILLPRIKKVAFTPEWKDGKPKRMANEEEVERSPRIVKVVRLESYEDALNNITFDQASGQQALDLFGDEYMMRYMLAWEVSKSETLLDVEKLQSPFSYKLHIHRDGETRAQPVDLPETFTYLLGLDVEKRKVYHDDGRRYLCYRGTTRDGRRTAVIWREIEGWYKEDYERDRDFVAEHKMTEGAVEVFVNGDSLIPGAQSLDSLFKTRMFAPVEA